MRWVRFLMGIGVLAALVPALMVTVPGVFSTLGLSGESEPGSNRMTAAIGEDSAVNESDVPAPTDQARIRPACSPQPCPDQVSAPEGENTLVDPAATTGEKDDPSTSTGATENVGSDDNGGSTPDTAPSNTSTDTQPPTTVPTTTTAPTASAVITGGACPCTVTGITELKGDVSLEGDITVDGGTLIARPGVDVDGNGFQIMFINGGKADFQGSSTSTWSGNGSNVNISRDVSFRNMRRIIFTSGAGKSVLRYFTVIDSGTSDLGDYPLHWHLNGNSVRGTVVEGVAVVNGRNHAFVPHGSHGITFRDTIAKNTRGDAYWWDPPGSNGSCTQGVGCDPIDNSNDILYDHALADGVTGSRGVAGFVLGAGNNLIVRNSAAINITSTNPSKRFCTGFKWPEFTNGSSRGVNTVWTFKNNFSYSPSGCDGINVWQNDGANHVIDGFSGSGIDHGAYGNKYVYRNFDVDDVLVHAAGWRMENGHAGDVVTARHRSDTVPTVRLDNVTVDSFTINNAGNDGDVPGVYVLNGSGLTCPDIVYKEVVPGTKVILDGLEC